MMSFYDDTSCIIDCSKLDRQISHDYDALKSYCTPQTPTTYFFYEIQEIPQHIRLLEYIRRLPTTITVFVSTHRHSMID